ncbi:hypothetical protein Q31b_42880 [Novipirellula aureliae]|uniref:Uncharacterized protein n=1 Tax=Novipirellula aureliae TaxID=2527966 RepID=A0A5C6DKV4_9BACT|nr:hypothetical protein [Novipirellula aureliae]TWU37500.1 hypothetical protein Q31b_42880 [Novipirellula aureliae]
MKTSLWDYAVSLEGNSEALSKVARLLGFLIERNFEEVYLEVENREWYLRKIVDSDYVDNLRRNKEGLQAFAERLLVVKYQLRGFCAEYEFDRNCKVASPYDPDLDQWRHWMAVVLEKNQVPHRSSEWQESTKLLVEELTNLRCRHTANLFDVLSEQRVLGVEQELWRMIWKSLSSCPPNTRSSLTSISINTQKTMSKMMTEHLVKCATDLLGLIVWFKWIYWRQARLDAIRNRQTKKVEDCLKWIKSYDKLRKQYDYPDWLSGKGPNGDDWLPSMLQKIDALEAQQRSC